MLEAGSGSAPMDIDEEEADKGHHEVHQVRLIVESSRVASLVSYI